MELDALAFGAHADDVELQHLSLEKRGCLQRLAIAHPEWGTRELAVEFFAEVIARRLPAVPPAQPTSAPF